MMQLLAFSIVILSISDVLGQDIDGPVKSDVIQVPGVSVNLLSQSIPYVIFRNNLYNGQYIRSDYNMTPGIGVHKLHKRTLTWNRARRYCKEEGGHLAVIRSEVEAKILLQMMLEESIEDVWIGLHDQFEDGDWITVTDEPLATVQWSVFTKDFPRATRHCIRLIRTPRAMDNETCNIAKPFICKISTM